MATQALMDGRWVTVRGSHLFIKDGQSLDSALAERTGTGAGARADMVSATRVGGKKNGRWVDANGREVKSVRIPPAWRDVKVAPDMAHAKVLATGVDGKGRVQSIYSQVHAEAQATRKFAKVEQLDTKAPAIIKRVRGDALSALDEVAEPAATLALIAATGIRPGSTKDTGGEKQAFGATTLEARHVYTRGDEVHLKFVGKKGVGIDIPVTDRAVAADVVRRAAIDGPHQRLFAVTAMSLLAYAKDVSGGARPKDFRTWVGTTTARRLVAKLQPARSEKEYKGLVRGVAVEVATRLGNTPVVALQSYIDPRVFGRIKYVRGTS